MTDQKEPQVAADRISIDSSDVIESHTRLACGDAPDADATFQTHLNQLVEAEIVPRLMLAHTLPPRATKKSKLLSSAFEASLESRAANVRSAKSAAEPFLRPTSEQVELLCRYATTSDLRVTDAYVQSLSEEGMSEEAILLDLVSPAARRLGDMWNSDDMDFMTVSMGMIQLEQLVHRISRRSPSLIDAADDQGNRVLLVTPPEEQHTFGILLLSEFFRHAGWFVRSEPRAPQSDLRSIVKTQYFSVVGVSCSRGCLVDDLRHSIAGLRRASCNRGLVVLVGGALFTVNPSLAMHVGADGAAADASEAVVVAGELTLKSTEGRALGSRRDN